MARPARSCGVALLSIITAGGDLELVSDPGRGTCVRCTFPLADAHRAHRDTASA
jgi:hypothetical protein